MQNFISGSLVWDNKDMYKDLARIMFITALFRIVSDDNLYTIVIGSTNYCSYINQLPHGH